MAAPPIIIVPGIPGTRLVTPSGRRVWDPAPTGGRSRAIDAQTLANTDLQLEPAATTDNIPFLTQAGSGHRAPPVLRARQPPELRRLQGIPNFGNLVYGAYSGLALALTSPEFQTRARARFGAVPRVYAAGYDWRRSNTTSAGRLKRVVETALNDTGAQQVILVAHSMGGLASRWFCKHHTIRGRQASGAVAALILLGSPTHGAPQAYRWLKFGLSPVERPRDDFLFALALLEAVVRGREQYVIRSFGSVYELLPTAYFCARNPDWLRFDAAKAGLADASVADDLYENRYTGFGRPLAWRRTFDARLGLYMPSPTFVVYSDRLTTEFAYELYEEPLRPPPRPPFGSDPPMLWEPPPWGRPATRLALRDVPGPCRPCRGDGTVPVFSGRAEGCRLGGGRRIMLPGVKHNSLGMDRRVTSAVEDIILRGIPRPGDFPLPRRDVALA